jgi:predicted nucleic acid-binding protein
VILYLDTSALIKLYVDEKYSEQVRDAFANADLCVCHVIGYIEFYAAVARLHRESVLTDEEYAQLKSAFSDG